MLIEKSTKNPIFSCEPCKYFTAFKKDFNKHLLTSKHIKLTIVNTNSNDVNEKHPQSFLCNVCTKEYKSRVGLWKHHKICKPVCNNIIVPDNLPSSTNIPIDKDVITMNMTKNVQLIKENQSNDIQNNDMILAIFNEVIKQNQEFQKTIVEQFQKTIVEQNNKIIELSSKSQVTNNNNCTTTNAKFNLQFFLNETCKDAMNIMDFVDSVKLQLSDLEKIGNAGFVNGISNIIIKNLKDLDVTKRPLHCTDSKREVLYVKDENKWEKENDEKDKMKKVINKISTKNIQQIPEWVDQHPDCKDGDSRTNNQYLHIVSESMGCCEPANYGKIIHNVSKQVIVDK